MSFPLNANIPQPGDDPSISQGQLLTNFGSISGWAAVDHVGYGVSTASGEHNQVTFAQNNIPGGVPADPSSILFTKNNLAGHPYPFFLNSQAGSVAAALALIPDLVVSGTNYGFKLGPIIFNFGLATGSPGGASVTFAIPMNNMLSITSGVNNTVASATATFNSVTNTGCNIRSTIVNAVWYFAIGN